MSLEKDRAERYFRSPLLHFLATMVSSLFEGVLVKYLDPNLK